MIIGVPKETKTGETRVALIPETCRRLIGLGATVVVETAAGLGAGFSDADYAATRAVLEPVAAKI